MIRKEGRRPKTNEDDIMEDEFRTEFVELTRDLSVSCVQHARARRNGTDMRLVPDSSCLITDVHQLTS